MFERILVPLDGSELAESALPYAERLAEKMGSKLYLLQVVPSLAEIIARTTPVGDGAMMPALTPDPDLGFDLYDQERKESQAYLERLGAGLAQRGVNVEIVVREGRPAESIREEIEGLSADLVIMSTHGRTGLAHLVFGSVTEEIIKTVPEVPVFLVRHGKIEEDRKAA